MWRGGRCRLVVWATLFFALSKVALSHAQQTHPPQPPRDLQLLDIRIPQASGYVTETHQPVSSEPPSAIVVHIQEAHTNYEAQQSIIAILKQLVEAYGLKLILVEGGEGDVGLSYLREYGPPAHRMEVAQKYLRAGLISAEEYLDLVSDHPLTLWGVEQQPLYQKNVEVFLKLQPIQESLQPALAALREAADLLKPALLDPALNELDATARAFERQEVSLSDYAGLLEQLSTRFEVAVADFPNLERFLAVRTQERQLDRAKVQREQRALLARLGTQLSQDAMESLLHHAAELQAGTAAPLEFYTALQHVAATSTIDLAAYPHLSQYITYLTHSDAVSATALAQELGAFADALRIRLASTVQSLQLSDVLQALDLLDKLIRFDLSPEEYQRLVALDLTKLQERWGIFLNEQLERAGLSRRMFEQIPALEAQLPALHRFYDVARERDEALVANAIAKLQQTGERLAVLITGGFHSPRITRLLKERGVATLVLVPKVSQATDERLYRAVVRYKSGQGGSVDEVMDLANQQGH